MKKEEPILNENLYPIDDLIFSVLKFVDDNIENFYNYFQIATNEYKQHDSIIKENLEQEDDITIILCRFLTDHNADFHFEFQTKTPEVMGGTDIGILRKYSKPRHIPFCIFEAKRLPTPIYQGSQSTEYVCYKKVKKQGGVERFKTNTHGSKLSKSIMMAYIQKETSLFWFNKINSWIDDEILATSNASIKWNSIDKLIEESSFVKPKISKYHSEHSRISNSNIKLVHYWIDLT